MKQESKSMFMNVSVCGSLVIFEGMTARDSMWMFAYLKGQ